MADRGDWHGSEQLCVTPSCLPGLITKRSLYKPGLRTDLFPTPPEISFAVMAFETW